eukprot:CAMPEP_0173274202 /NCGR_PEP_ID=MMETSP1143-20121109/2318_1 /TAXON_ID=483371 /ORGANISM="non described non described, Strain CCMP2298" /LENGTH=212 /DNA_ID=CAMNT_0014211005 /DNA_START=716 /DNA_END=1355 /DNA_ORIENTATION=+
MQATPANADATFSMKTSSIRMAATTSMLTQALIPNTANSSNLATSLDTRFTSIPVPVPLFCSADESSCTSLSWIRAVEAFFQFQPVRMLMKNSTWCRNTCSSPKPLSNPAHMKHSRSEEALSRESKSPRSSRGDHNPCLEEGVEADQEASHEVALISATISLGRNQNGFETAKVLLSSPSKTPARSLSARRIRSSYCSSPCSPLASISFATE